MSRENERLRSGFDRSGAGAGRSAAVVAAIFALLTGCATPARPKVEPPAPSASGATTLETLVAKARAEAPYFVAHRPSSVPVQPRFRAQVVHADEVAVVLRHLDSAASPPPLPLYFAIFFEDYEGEAMAFAYVDGHFLCARVVTVRGREFAVGHHAVTDARWVDQSDYPSLHHAGSAADDR